MTDTKFRPVRFNGRYWTGIGVREAALMGAILRHAFKNDSGGRGIPEGKLANLCVHNLSDERWQAAINFLTEHEFVTLDGGLRKDSVNVCCTGMGRDYALELCAAQQAEGKATTEEAVNQ